jgi:hypothetical protein
MGNVMVITSSNHGVNIVGLDTCECFKVTTVEQDNRADLGYYPYEITAAVTSNDSNTIHIDAGVNESRVIRLGANMTIEHVDPLRLFGIRLRCAGRVVQCYLSADCKHFITEESCVIDVASLCV